jgi:CRP-like cAMP-binding protein
LKVEECQRVINELQKQCEERDNNAINSLIGNLKFFIKFPLETRKQLFDIGSLICYEKNQVIFKQGEKSEDFYVIIKGSVCVKTVKEELGKEPVNTRVCYDGDYVGELAHFQVSESLTKEIVDSLNR